MSQTGVVAVNQTVPFGKLTLPVSQVFLLRKNVYACVNLKPVAPGHVLVIARRPVKRMHELTEVESLDIWTTVQQVSRVIEQIYKARCTVAVQDGLQAGQTVEHVHFHVIPAQSSESGQSTIVLDGEEREARTLEDMQKEAERYKAYFDQGFAQA